MYQLKENKARIWVDWLDTYLWASLVEHIIDQNFERTCSAESNWWEFYQYCLQTLPQSWRSLIHHQIERSSLISKKDNIVSSLHQKYQENQWWTHQIGEVYLPRQRYHNKPWRVY